LTSDGANRNPRYEEGIEQKNQRIECAKEDGIEGIFKTTKVTSKIDSGISKWRTYE